MRIVLFILFAFFISCQKQKGISKPETSIQEKTKLIAARTTDKLLKTDTVFVYDSGELNPNFFVLAHLLDKKMDKDSLLTMSYRLDFYKDKKPCTEMLQGFFMPFRRTKSENTSDKI